MKILVFADLHYFGDDLMNAMFNTKRKLVEYAVPVLDKLVEISKNENYSYVVNLGDLIQDTNSAEKDKAALLFMFDKLREFMCPCFTVFGNHDMKMTNSVKEIEQLAGFDTSTYSVDAEGFHFIFLTTEVRPELGLDRGGIYKTQYLSEESIEWLKNDLERNSLPCLIFTHYPLAEDNRVPDECMFLKNRARVKEIIRGDKNILAVFSGHQHTPREVEENGLMYYVVGSPTSSLHENGVPTGVYIEIETYGNNIKVTRKIIDDDKITKNNLFRYSDFGL